MPLKIVRNDITKMTCDAIVNTANPEPIVGEGCDTAVYTAAGWGELLQARKRIGEKKEGEAFITDAFQLPCKYIIHAVSPFFFDGASGEEEKLRSCYQNSLALARQFGIRSIAFPLISTGSYGYPKEEGMRIAIDEINAFLMQHYMQVYVVVFDEESTALGMRVAPDLEAYIDSHYVEEKSESEYGFGSGIGGDFVGSGFGRRDSDDEPKTVQMWTRRTEAARRPLFSRRDKAIYEAGAQAPQDTMPNMATQASMPNMAPQAPRPNMAPQAPRPNMAPQAPMPNMAMAPVDTGAADFDFDEAFGAKLKERMAHLSDTFSEYLLYLISSKNMTNADVYKRAIVDKKAFSKIKNNPKAHPQKITAMCLCIGAMLNLDETRDLLARAGYALSPCDKTDVIFSYFIENKIYDMIELDLQLEAHGLPCLIE